MFIKFIDERNDSAHKNKDSNSESNYYTKKSF